MTGRQDTSIHQGMRLYDGTDYDSIVERVAYGGFGVIAFGRNANNNDTMMAYKTLSRELIADRATAASFVREGLLWIGLWDHPNITTAYAVLRMSDAQGPRPFIALQYAENGSLRDLLRAAARRQPGGRLPLALGLDLAQQIAAGLAYLHQPDPAYLRPEPTVHRDLKPENVLIMDDGRAVITDFGLAKIIEDAAPETLATLVARLGGGVEGAGETEGATRTAGLHTAAGIALGTVAYMPPEQWQDARYAGPPADIYAFGIMLSELLAGRHALLDLEQRHTQEDWRQAHARPAPRLLRTANDAIPLEVETLYLRCLAADPAARPTAAQALATLQAGARAAGVSVYEPVQMIPHTPYNEVVHWHQWSNACVNFDRLDEALERNERALSLARQIASERPDLLPVIYMTRGNILKAIGKQALDRGDRAAATRYDAQAMTAFQDSLNTRPPETTEEGRTGRSYVWHQIGVFHKQRERWAEAEAAYARALALKPGMPDTYYNRALNMLSWGRDDLAARRMAEAVAHLRQGRVFAVTAVGLKYPPASMVLEAIEAALRELGEA